MEQSAIANHEAAGHDMARNKEGKQPLCPLEYGLDIFNGK